MGIKLLYFKFKMKFALFAIIATATAIRFDSTELSEREEENLVRPALIANNAMVSESDHRRSFSQGLSDAQNGKVHWDTEFRADGQELMSNSRSPVIQPSQDMLSREEQMRLVKEANDELTVRHTAPLPDAAQPQEAPAKSP